MSAGSAAGLQALLLGAALLLPWLLLLSLPIVQVSTRRLLLSFAPVPALLAALLLPEGTALAVPLLPAGLSFGMDATARAFLLPAALIWVLSGWMAAPLLPKLAGSPAFGALWLLALAGNLALILAQDLLALYAGIALMTFAALGLIVFERTPQALGAGRLYLAMMLAAELALFVAVAVLVAAAEGDTRFDAVTAVLSGPTLALLALAFGLKLGVLGLHSWLPRAHPVAPVPASAVLSGVMIKAGVLGWLRLVAPAGDLVAPAVPPLVVVLGLAGALYAVLRGLPTRDPKVLLGWSSVSQMGSVTVLAGLALQSGSVGGAAVAAIAVFVMHHGLAKAALFLGVGLLAASRGRRRRRVWVGLWLPALALAAAPGTSGVLAKSALEGAVAATGPGASVTTLLYLASVASALLMLRFLWLARRLPVPDSGEALAVGRNPELPWMLMLGGLLVLPWMTVRDTPMFAAAVSAPEQLAAVIPLLLALIVGAAAWRWPVPLRVAEGTRRRVLPMNRPSAALSRRSPGPLQLANWERHLHAWRLIGRVVVLVALALGGAILYGPSL
jgi:hydrogenase-4 component B